MSSQPFVLIMDVEPIEGHVFGTLKRRVGDNWVALEYRCRLCNRLPIELLTTNYSVIPCAGLTKEIPK